MEIDALAVLGTEGLVALAVQVQQQNLKIEFLMRTVGARINGNDPEAGYLIVQADCARYVESHSAQLSKLREYLDVLEKARNEMAK